MIDKAYTEFEREVLKEILAGEGEPFESLRRQLAESSVKKRELSGTGFFTEIRVDRSVCLAADTKTARLQLGDVTAEIDGLEQGAGFVLFVVDGYLDLLEGFSYGEPWPKSIQGFSLAKTQPGPLV